VTLSVVIITFNEESNLPRTLASVKPLIENGQGEIIVVDSGSTDRTLEIAKSFGARVFVEEWKGFAAQKNSAIDKATGDWILSLDADEEIDGQLQQALKDTLESLTQVAALETEPRAHPRTLEDARSDLQYHVGAKSSTTVVGLWIPRKNSFLGRWMKHGGFWPDPKLRFFRRGAGRFEDRAVHEDVQVTGPTEAVRYGALLHHAYPTLSVYVEHMNRYSTLGAEMVVARGYRGLAFVDILIRPIATFIYNYFFRLGFLDGREGLLLHVYHSIYVCWKYAKVWELNKSRENADSSLRSE